MKTFNFKKAVQALNYFCHLEGGKINYMKAIKLIWISDRIHVRTYGRTITNDQYIAMKNGMVPSGTKDIVRKSRFLEDEVLNYSNEFLSLPVNYEVSALSDTLLEVFSKTDIKILNSVYEHFKKFSQFDLSTYSHKFAEWKRFESLIDAGIKKSFSIEVDDFFKEANEDDLFAQDAELLSLSKEQYNETC